MIKKGDTIDIKMSEGEFIGVVGYQGSSCIELKDVVMVSPVKDQPRTMSFIPMKNTLIFYGNMVVMALNDKHPYYAKYKQATSGIVLPGPRGKFTH